MIDNRADDGRSLRRHIQWAINQAKRSNFEFKNGSQFRLGSLVLYKGRVISRGFNKNQTHPRMKKLYGHNTVHAECDSLMRAAKGDTLIVVRILRNGELACSKPCPRCLHYIQDYGIRTVIYIDWDGNIIQESVKNMNCEEQ